MDFVISSIYAFTYPIRLLFNFISRWTPGFKSLPSISPAMRVALMVLLFLLTIWTAAFLKNFFGATEKSALNWWKWTFGALPFVIVIPIVVYYLIKFWMMREVSRYPEIDRVWQQGLDECEKHGIELVNVPVFVVLGNPDHRRASQLVRSSAMTFPVSVPESGNADITLYVNSEAAFLFLDGCNCISLLARGGSAGGSSSAAAMPVGGPGGQSPMATLDPFAQQTPESGAAPASPITQTLTESGIMSAAEGPANPPSGGMGMGGATLQLPDGQTAADFIGKKETVSAKPVQSTSQDMYDREQKLKHVCGLLSKARNTLCPINGVLTLLPFELIENASGPLQTAAQKDLQTLQTELKVRCPNTIVVTELEKEEGFQELINRVGSEKCREFRFGKGCELWSNPEENRLRAVGVHAAGAFEDWIYMLFQEADSLKHRYNSRLFRLLCRIRGKFTDNLQNVLAQGFGFDPRTEPEMAAQQFLFGGCYFAAAGSRPGQHAFVKSVFQKLLQQEGELEWAPAARRRDEQLQFVANLFALVGALSFFAIVGMLVYEFWFAGKAAG